MRQNIVNYIEAVWIHVSVCIYFYTSKKTKLIGVVAENTL